MRMPSERVEAMWERYRRGASRREIAAEFEVGIQRVSKLLARYGYPLERAARRRRDVERARRLYQLYEQGASVPEVAEQAGLTSSRVHQIFSAFGLPRLERDARHAAGRARATAMHERYASGASLEQVGREFGVTGAAVRDALLRYGFSTRPRGGLRSTSFGQSNAWQREPAAPR